MNTILILLQTLILGDPDLQLPPPESYQKLYCQYHHHPVCGNMPPEEPEAEAEDAGVIT
jgi:hypothetical protein